MSDIAKWALLVAAAIVIIGLILTLPIMDALDGSIFSNAIATIVSVCGEGFRFARGAINNLLSPWARTICSGLMIYFFGKEFLTLGIKILIWVYHFIFK